MFNDKVQNQEGGENSSNFQGQTVNVQYGISYRDAKEIALDVFKSNFIQLKNEAAEIAKQRAEEITENFLGKLNEKAPEAIQEFNQPGLQDALFTAQKEFAKSGDKELGDLLVDILVDRANSPVRNMVQIVLDEALKTAPRLTVQQMDTITLNFLLTQTVNPGLVNLDQFKQYLLEDILPFVENTTKERSSYNYIEYLGCGHIRAGNYGQLENNLLKRYKAMFQKGFSKDEFGAEAGPFEEYNSFIIPCFHDPTKFQLNRLDDSGLENAMTEKNLNDEQKTKLRAIWNKFSMQQQEIKEFLIKIDAKMETVFDVWQNSQFNAMELTSVGIAVAHANYRRKTGKTLDLTKWIK